LTPVVANQSSRLILSAVGKNERLRAALGNFSHKTSYLLLKLKSIHTFIIDDLYIDLKEKVFQIN